MILIRDVFRLHFGKAREAIALAKRRACSSSSDSAIRPVACSPIEGARRRCAG
jgi:hypothetical protein